MKDKIERLIVDVDVPCRIRYYHDDNEISVNFDISKYNLVGTYLEVEYDLLNRFMVIAERLMAERGIRYAEILKPDSLSMSLNYIVVI